MASEGHIFVPGTIYKVEIPITVVINKDCYATMVWPNAIQWSLVGNGKCNLYNWGANRVVSQLVVCTTGAQHLHALPGNLLRRSSTTCHTRHTSKHRRTLGIAP
jgi:hypothetical protein